MSPSFDHHQLTSPHLPVPPAVMYRPLAFSHRYQAPQWWQVSRACLLLPLTLWICVLVSLRYGYYGNCRMVLGPNSSRLIEASSIFVKQVQIRDDDKKQQVVLHSYAEKPELSNELMNWSVSDYMIVGSFSRKGFPLWLNKGSRIRIKLEAQTISLQHLQVDIIKGEHRYKTLKPNSAGDTYPRPEYTDSVKEAEYTIEEDDKYYVGLTNSHSRGVILRMHLHVSSRMYDTSMAASGCSAVSGACRLNLVFPSAQYITVSTPNNGGFSEWYIELSFVARVVTYIAILGFVVLVILLVLKYLGSCNGDRNMDNESNDERATSTERDPIMSTKQIIYGTCEDEEKGLGSSDSSLEDLYDGKICVICYDQERNCFFVPCGHCATCHECAQRIMADESKVCPICRRLVLKVRRLFRA